MINYGIAAIVVKHTLLVESPISGAYGNSHGPDLKKISSNQKHIDFSISKSSVPNVIPKWKIWHTLATAFIVAL